MIRHGLITNPLFAAFESVGFFRLGIFHNHERSVLPFPLRCNTGATSSKPGCFLSMESLQNWGKLVTRVARQDSEHGARTMSSLVKVAQGCKPLITKGLSQLQIEAG